VRRAAAAGRSPEGTVVRILLIEDNESNAYLARFVLERRGHQVVEARNGAAGVEQARAGPYDAVLLDLRLPDGDGCEFVPRLAALGPAPIIVLSAHATPADRERSRQAGCAGFIEKPIDVSRFVERVEGFVRRVPPATAAQEGPAERPLR
jgi:CheY-like chemotaxis protein